MNTFTRNTLWVLFYLFFTAGPLFVLLIGPLPPSRDFWTEFSAAAGYAGLAILGLQVGLTARFRAVTRPWGEDIIYHFHKQISFIALALIIAHPVILFILRPERLALLNFIEAPWRARFAAISTYSLIALMVMALWRVKLKISYEVWHYTHIILAVLVIGAGLLHTFAWGFYLDAPLKRTLWTGLAILWCCLLIYTRIVRPFLMLRKPYQVIATRNERGGSTTLVMQPIGHTGFPFVPGQFGWLNVWGSPFKLTSHPFSFSSSAEMAKETIEMTIQDAGDYTRKIRNVTTGKRVYIDGPYGAFTVGNPADMHVLIAGGIGITPMMSIIRTFADHGDKRPIILIYGNKNWDGITFREELEALSDRINLQVIHVLEQPPKDWTGETGFINSELIQRYIPAPYEQHEYFICGPNRMMDEIEKTLAALHVPLTKYHSERYHFV